jgi:hypothetical protein
MTMTHLLINKVGPTGKLQGLARQDGPYPTSRWWTPWNVAYARSPPYHCVPVQYACIYEYLVCCAMHS